MMCDIIIAADTAFSQPEITLAPFPASAAPNA